MRVKGYDNVWVLIQFGHNDQPGKPGRSTDLATEFPANLRRYVTEARAADAKPILVTPLTRRMFVNGKLETGLDPWAAAVRKVAADMNVPLIDLNARSQAVVAAMGPAMATHYAMVAPPADVAAAALTGTTIEADKTPPTSRPQPAPGGLPMVASVTPAFDYTHLNRAGADLFAGLIADELAIAVPQMRPLLVP